MLYACTKKDQNLLIMMKLGYIHQASILLVFSRHKQTGVSSASSTMDLSESEVVTIDEANSLSQMENKW